MVSHRLCISVLLVCMPMVAFAKDWLRGGGGGNRISLLDSLTAAVTSSSSGISRALQGGEEEEGLPMCPPGTTLFETFYNVLFQVVATDPITCNEFELTSIGVILQEEFDNLLVEDGSLVDAQVELLSSETEVCAAYDDAMGNNNNNNNYRRRQQQQQQQQEPHAQRRTRYMFQLFTYRSVGTCYLCYHDNFDHYRNLEQQQQQQQAQETLSQHRERRLPSATVGDSIMDYFADVIEGLERQLDVELTRALLIRSHDANLSCLSNVGVSVESTVMIKTEEIENVCATVYCCAERADPDGGCKRGNSNFCHTSQERCETGCHGMWIDALDPPTCLGEWSQCELDSSTGSCCPGSVCTYQNDWYAQCMPGNGGGVSDAVVVVEEDSASPTASPAPTTEPTQSLVPSDAPTSQCTTEWTTCHDDPVDVNSCCEGLVCERHEHWSQCRKPTDATSTPAPVQTPTPAPVQTSAPVVVEEEADIPTTSSVPSSVPSLSENPTGDEEECTPEWTTCHDDPVDNDSCCEGLVCDRHEHWSQCREPSNVDNDEQLPPPPPPADDNGVCTPEWEDCHGHAEDPCCPGYYCKQQEWYSICRRGAKESELTSGSAGSIEQEFCGAQWDNCGEGHHDCCAGYYCRVTEWYSKCTPNESS